MKMLANEMSDEIEPAYVAGMDRAELIARIKSLEEQRSAWELRVRACQERESMYTRFLNDMGTRLAGTYQAMHDAVSVEAAQAEGLVEAIKKMMKQVEIL